MEVNKETLPKGWTIAKISDLGELIRGVNYKKEHSSSSPKPTYIPILRANNIKGKLNFDDLVYVDKKFVEGKQLVKKGDIVFAMSSGSKHLVGKSAKANSDFNGGFGAFCAVFRTDENLVSDYLAYYFQSPFYKNFIRNIASGTNINNLKRDNILAINFPLAPLNEQKRILAKLEQLLTDLDKGIEYLETTKQQLKVYRQAVLKWAFEDIKEFTTLNDVGSWMGGGTPSTQKKEYWNDGYVLWVSSQDVKSKYINDTERKITELAIENSSTKWIKKGSLLFPVLCGYNFSSSETLVNTGKLFVIWVPRGIFWCIFRLLCLSVERKMPQGAPAF